MSRPERSLRVVLGGMVGGVPGHGGAAWAVLQYALGLQRLGHEVLLVESVTEGALRPGGAPLAASDNAAYAAAVLDGAGLAGSWSLLAEGTRQTAGLPYDDVRRFAADADVLVNLAGTLRDPELVERVPVRVFVDIDPGFTQVWEAAYGADLGLAHHTHFATYGAGIATGERPVPDCGRRWTPTVPPVVLDLWAPDPGPGTDDAASWTTVANWRSYGTVEIGDLRLGQKAHSWRTLVDLPRRVGAPFEVALAIDPGDEADRRALEASGWRIVDPAGVAATPDAYRRFVRSSKAELAVAKRGYVDAATGWFSDRSACYLAAGRPVVAQETGFSSYLPTGAGLLAFTTLDEAADAVAAVAGEYERHRRAALSVAREAFDSDRVLTELLAHAAVPA